MKFVMSFKATFFLAIVLCAYFPGQAQFYAPFEEERKDQVVVYGQSQAYSSIENNANLYNLMSLQRIRLGLTWEHGDVPISVTGSAGFNEPLLLDYPTVPFAILDAYATWKPMSSLSMRAGQFVLPGLRERMIASSQMVFDRRSLLSETMSDGRDMGYHLQWTPSVGNMYFELNGAITKGEGYWNNTFSPTRGNGLLYSAQISVYPFGEFERNGEQSFFDVTQQSSPKVAISAMYSFNDNAYLSHGSAGTELPFERDVEKVGADILFKYSGFSFLAQYALSNIDIPVVYEAASNGTTFSPSYFYEGEGMSFFAGYAFPKGLDLSAQFSIVNPIEIVPVAARQRGEVSFGYRIKDTGARVGVSGTWDQETMTDITNASTATDVYFGGRLFLQWALFNAE